MISIFREVRESLYPCNKQKMQNNSKRNHGNKKKCSRTKDTINSVEDVKNKIEGLFQKERENVYSDG